MHLINLYNFLKFLMNLGDFEMKQFFTKRNIYIGLFAILYLIVAFSSFWHAIEFFALTNHSWMSIILAFAFKDNRAFCKYICPITVFMKPMSFFSLFRIKCDTSKCISCGKCKMVCPMDVDMTDNSRKRQNGTDCILCFECTKVCPKKAL